MIYTFILRGYSTCTIIYRTVKYNTRITNLTQTMYVALLSSWIFTAAARLANRGRLFYNLGAANMNTLSPRGVLDFPERYFNKV